MRSDGLRISDLGGCRPDLKSFPGASFWLFLLFSFVGIDLLRASICLSADREESFATNLDVIIHISRHAAAESVQDLFARGGMDSPSEGERILLTAQGDHDGDWIVRGAFSEALIRHGFSVLSKVRRNDRALLDRVSPVRKVLSYRIVDLGVTYVRQHRRRWMGRRWIDRFAKAKFSVQLMDASTGSVLWLDESEAQQWDKFPIDRLDTVEHSLYKSARAKLEERHLGRALEPVIVSAVVGMLVYLFFSNR